MKETTPKFRELTKRIYRLEKKDGWIIRILISSNLLVMIFYAQAVPNFFDMRKNSRILGMPE
jgi:hypothetical protein